MLRFIEVSNRKESLIIDGYSDKKYQKSAIKEIGRWIAENVDKGEGESLIEYGKDSLCKNYMDGNYFFEMEEVPCACRLDEETEEMEYADGNWYFVIRIIK